jgi:hypothetical protein
MSSRSPYLLPGIVVAVLLVMGIAAAVRHTGGASIELPQGEQEVTGTLTPVSLSATRRGTHVLEVNGKPYVFVESEESLKSYEGLKVTVRGTFEENIDPSLLPVLVATDIRTRALALTQWKHPKLGITLSVPSAWSGSTTDTALRFTVPGVLEPVLVIARSTEEELPGGPGLAVGGEKAVSVKDGSGEVVYVERAGGLLEFAFQPANDMQDRAQDEYEFHQVVLRSVVFEVTKPPVATGTGSVGSGSGTVLGSPCGGAAGILCPVGQYCEVTDSVTDIGRCKKVR